MNDYKNQICLVTGRSSEGRGLYILNANLIDVIESIKYNNFNWKIIVINNECNLKNSFIIIKIFNIILAQIKNIHKLINYKNNFNIVIFTMGSIYFLPMLAAKIMRKKNIYFISGLAGRDTNLRIMRLIYKDSLFGLGGYIFPIIISNLENINYILADLIVVESPSLAHQIWPDSSNKLILNGSLFVNTRHFYPKINLLNRANLIGYFGALNEHKGIINYMEAIPLIIETMGDVQFIIGGAGDSSDKIKRDIIAKNIGKKVKLHSIISHDLIPDYLNSARLIVLPSYGEGLPNIVLEAMACGTPVLATPVGGIPDLIKDGATGFLMENNSPECIAANVCRALKHPNLERIAICARNLIENEYTLENAVLRWKTVLDMLQRK